MDKRKLFGEEDRVLRFAVIAAVVLFVIAIIAVSVRMTNLRVDSSAGEKKLKEFEKIDVQAVDAKIRELEEQERAEDDEWQNRPYSEMFANSVILGDSITEGLEAYEILEPALVAAEKGLGLHVSEDSELEEILGGVIEAKPQKLFIALGMNDVVTDRGDASVFAEDYGALLDRLAAEIPDTAVYVNSVLPVSGQAAADNGSFARIPEFNAALQTLCEEKGVTFIDNTELVGEDSYEDDGIHMEKEFYPLWLDHMAEVAEL